VRHLERELQKERERASQAEAALQALKECDRCLLKWTGAWTECPGLDAQQMQDALATLRTQIHQLPRRVLEGHADWIRYSDVAALLAAPEGQS